ncbi:MAG: hypothetical protein AAGG11_23085, partial [Pseudomonadota bacterium]
AAGLRRKLVFTASMLCLLGAIYGSDLLWGFWPGLFTALTGYMLLCSLLPWLDLARRRYAG